ncbi:Co2+/Mg2+ efflux protein ApaG [uncultured Nitratireductor sp.]|uniref:Co2+/Mg2+ efflux protein ApaG n=1 Tax=uncultured Nitratireductor sp. TaxID=520953 RepID=UPI0025D09E7A|nr:Co2+/Mg2+ efflux protein ApaG [uncultured Nitratireductor sp.]
MYRAVTQSIEVSAEPSYLSAQSDPESGHFVWAYRITITNHSPLTVQLVARYWHITDETGRVQEVRGEGVVGEQPVLEPGDSYTYTSGCPLSAPSGIMVGRYTMRGPRGAFFDVDIPAFSLDLPGAATRIN